MHFGGCNKTKESVIACVSLMKFYVFVSKKTIKQRSDVTQFSFIHCSDMTECGNICVLVFELAHRQPLVIAFKKHEQFWLQKMTF